jgi:hypothetical protein
MREEKITNYPALPGAPILHTAGPLGLDDPHGQFIVKNKIVNSLIKMGYNGAAAAVCILLLRDALSGENCGAGLDCEAGALLLKSISTLLPSQTYRDRRTQ